jgi:hypothetical protein
MAKGRMLARSIAYDPAFNKLTVEAQLLFLRAIPHLDRDGLAPGEPVVLWGHIAPLCPQLRDVTERAIGEWVAQGLVERYETDMGPVLWFTGFSRNQVGMVYAREGASIYPPPPGCCRQADGLQRMATLEAAVPAPDPPPPEVRAEPGKSAEPLSQTFQRLLDELRETPNKTGKLGEIFTLCFGEEPNFGRLGKLAKQGGAGRLAQELWQLSADRPAGDVLDYLTKRRQAQTKKNGAANGTQEQHEQQSEPDSEFLERFRAVQRSTT